ncbi:MAG: alpha/beta fold hydrolase [Parvularcula sp.]
MKTDFVDLLGLKIAYKRHGDNKRTIVLIHGNSACKEVYYRQFAHFMNSRYSFLAIDLPGHGESANSPCPEDDYTIPGYALRIADTLKVLGVKKHIIVGWSLGGQIALEMAGNDLVNPDKTFRGACIFGAPPIGPGMDGIEEAFHPAALDSSMADPEPSREDIDAYVRGVYGTLSPIPQQFFDCAYRTHGLARQIMVAHWMGGISGHRQVETVAKWKKPICVAHGMDDAFVSFDYLQKCQWKNLWKKSIQQFEHCGHAPFAEHAPKFNHMLDSFSADVF